MMLIDCQSHVFPEEYAEVLARNPGQPRAIPREDGYIITYGDIQKFTLRQEVYDIDRKIQDMDEAGVHVSILSVNMPGPEMLAPDLRLEGARACNDYIGRNGSRQK